jgi:hypothetical protein
VRGKGPQVKNGSATFNRLSASQQVNPIALKISFDPLWCICQIKKANNLAQIRPSPEGHHGRIICLHPFKLPGA